MSSKALPIKLFKIKPLIRILRFWSRNFFILLLPDFNQDHDVWRCYTKSVWSILAATPMSVPYKNVRIYSAVFCSVKKGQINRILCLKCVKVFL